MRQELVAILPRLRRYAYALTGSREEGDDLVQSACQRALEKGSKRGDAPLDRWVMRVMRNLWVDGHRARARRAEMPLDSADAPAFSFDGERALSTAPSNTLYAAGQFKVVPLNTFRSQTGQLCREYQARAKGRQAAVTGVACRNDQSQWHNEVMLSLGTAGVGGFTPATAGDGLKAMRPAWHNAEVLGPKAERALLRRWSEQGG